MLRRESLNHTGVAKVKPGSDWETKAECSVSVLYSQIIHILIPTLESNQNEAIIIAAKGKWYLIGLEFSSS